MLLKTCFLVFYLFSNVKLNAKTVARDANSNFLMLSKKFLQMCNILQENVWTFQPIILVSRIMNWRPK